MAIPVSPSSENLLTLLQQAQNLNAASQDAWIEDEEYAGVRVFFFFFFFFFFFVPLVAISL